MFRSFEEADLVSASSLLLENGYTCVICKGKERYTSCERGVLPLVQLLSEGRLFLNSCAADKVVGKASALLLILTGVKSVYAPVMSESALYILSYYGVMASCDSCVPLILNRAGTGPCPMEEAVDNVKDPIQGLKMIQRLIKPLQEKEA